MNREEKIRRMGAHLGTLAMHAVEDDGMDELSVMGMIALQLIGTAMAHPEWGLAWKMVLEGDDGSGCTDWTCIYEILIKHLPVEAQS